jgi:hypothetical protein
MWVGIDASVPVTNTNERKIDERIEMETNNISQIIHTNPILFHQ